MTGAWGGVRGLSSPIVLGMPTNMQSTRRVKDKRGGTHRLNQPVPSWQGEYIIFRELRRKHQSFPTLQMDPPGPQIPSHVQRSYRGIIGHWQILNAHENSTKLNKLPSQNFGTLEGFQAKTSQSLGKKNE